MQQPAVIAGSDPLSLRAPTRNLLRFEKIAGQAKKGMTSYLFACKQHHVKKRKRSESAQEDSEKMQNMKNHFFQN